MRGMSLYCHIICPPLAMVDHFFSFANLSYRVRVYKTKHYNNNHNLNELTNAFQVKLLGLLLYTFSLFTIFLQKKLYS